MRVRLGGKRGDPKPDRIFALIREDAAAHPRMYAIGAYHHFERFFLRVFEADIDPVVGRRHQPDLVAETHFDVTLDAAIEARGQVGTQDAEEPIA